jgi:hypothetical protein
MGLSRSGIHIEWDTLVGCLGLELQSLKVGDDSSHQQKSVLSKSIANFYELPVYQLTHAFPLSMIHVPAPYIKNGDVHETVVVELADKNTWNTSPACTIRPETPPHTGKATTTSGNAILKSSSVVGDEGNASLKEPIAGDTARMDPPHRSVFSTID